MVVIEEGGEVILRAKVGRKGRERARMRRGVGCILGYDRYVKRIETDREQSRNIEGMEARNRYSVMVQLRLKALVIPLVHESQ